MSKNLLTESRSSIIQWLTVEVWGFRVPRLEPWFCSLIAICAWPSHLTFWCLSFVLFFVFFLLSAEWDDNTVYVLRRLNHLMCVKAKHKAWY